MANCVKCGAKAITRRRSEHWFCKHCGMQPGKWNLDRAGLPTKRTPKRYEEEMRK